MQVAPDAHILVIEDDPDTRDSLCEALIDAGYLPFAVGDGVEALEHLRTGARPTLIILDLMLPRIDGWRFLSIVAEAPELSSIPVVVCSGAIDGARPPGVPRDHILPKPVDLDHLMAFVARYCGTRDHAPWSTPTTPKRKKRTTPSKRGRERV